MLGVVRQSQGFGLRVESDDRGKRPEDLSIEDRIVESDLREDRWLEEEAGPVRGEASRRNR